MNRDEILEESRKLVEDLKTLYERAHSLVTDAVEAGEAGYAAELKEFFNLINGKRYKQNIAADIREHIDKLKKENKDTNDLYALYNLIHSNEPDSIIDNLKSAGYGIAGKNGDSALASAIHDAGLRILELTRLNKKDEVIYRFLRIFMAQGKRMPDLIETLKDANNAYFKSYVFAFLSAFTEDKSKNNK